MHPRWFESGHICAIWDWQLCLALCCFCWSQWPDEVLSTRQGWVCWAQMVQNSAGKRKTHENNSILCYFHQWLILAKLSLAHVCGRADISFFTWSLKPNPVSDFSLSPLFSNFWRLTDGKKNKKKNKTQLLEICGLCKGAHLNRKQFSRKFFAATWNYTKTFGLMSQSCFPAVPFMTWFEFMYA